jgi:hypothetical protein
VVEVKSGKNSWFVAKSLKTVEPVPVNPEPSPMKEVAVTTPVTLIPVVEVFPVSKTVCKSGSEAVPVR